MLQHAADNAPKAIRELENYLGVTLPVPKLDLIALPGYTALPDSNWGLIIFKYGFFFFKSMFSF